MRLFHTIWFSICLIMFTACGLFQANSSSKFDSFPAPVGYVNDFENILTNEEEALLLEFIKRMNSEYDIQLAIHTTQSIEPYDEIHSYCTDLCNTWGLGEKETDNGIMITISESIRQADIQLGLGMEKFITNEQAKEVIDTETVPQCKNQNYYLAFRNSIDALMKWVPKR